MTRELIEDFTKIVKPFVQKKLLEENFEGMGEQDKAEFGRDFDEILSLAIKGLESSDWIPVTERLPEVEEEATRCLVTVDVGGSFDDYTAIRTYFSDTKDFNDVVTAWMPLPEPYKGRD